MNYIGSDIRFGICTKPWIIHGSWGMVGWFDRSPVSNCQKSEPIYNSAHKYRTSRSNPNKLSNLRSKSAFGWNILIAHRHHVVFPKLFRSIKPLKVKIATRTKRSEPKSGSIMNSDRGNATLGPLISVVCFWHWTVVYVSSISDVFVLQFRSKHERGHSINQFGEGSLWRAILKIIFLWS